MKHATFFDLKAYNLYKDFIEYCKKKQYESFLVLHKHHIIPKCLWSNDDASVNGDSNIVMLSVEDHITAHIMLANCYESDTYEHVANMRSARILNKNAIKDKNVLLEIAEAYKGNKNPFFGKTHTSDVISSLIEKGKKQKGINYEERYGNLANFEKQKRSIGVKKSWDNMSEDSKISRSKKQSESLKGKLTGSKNPYAKPMLVNEKYYGSLKEACESLKISPYKLYKYYKVEKLKK